MRRWGIWQRAMAGLLAVAVMVPVSSAVAAANASPNASPNAAPNEAAPNAAPNEAAPNASPNPAPAAAMPVAQQHDAVTGAKRQAKAENRRVEIESLRQERSTTWANPDGVSLHTELSGSPMRVRKNGGWVAVDPTLVEKNGVATPKATKTGLVLPDGNGSSTVSVKHAKGMSAIRWPGVLPKPRLQGATATYPDAVADGADLVFEATATGFQARIVLRHPPKPALAVRIPVSLPAFLRYDVEHAKLLAGDAEIADVSHAPMLDATALAGETDAAHRALANVSVGRDGQGPVLTVTPDEGFLNGGKAVYPVTVALPSDWVGAGLDADTFISNVQYPNSQTTATWLRAGKSSSGGETWRSYVKFFVAGTPLDGAKILNADLRMWNYRSNACGNAVGSGIVVRRITSAWSPSSLTWSNQPGTTTSGQSANQAAYSDTCSWGEGELFYSIETIVQDWASGSAPDYGVQMRAVNESDATNWRQYRASEYTGGSGRGPVLFVDYEPSRQEEILSVTGDIDPGTVTYEQAVATRVGTPAQESAAPAVSLEQAQAMRRDAQQGFAPGAETIRPAVDEDWSEELPECGGAQAVECFAELEPDLAPPVVTTTVPAADATGVSISTSVSATFDEPVTGAQVVVRNPAGAAIAGSSSTDADRITVTFTPAQPLPATTRLTVELTGATDESGNAMVPFAWSFTTGAAAPTTITLPLLIDGWIDDFDTSEFDGDVTWAGTYGTGFFSIHERTYLRFDTSALTGKTITDARLQLWGAQADGCGNAQSGIAAQRVTGAWNPLTLQWSTQPSATDAGQAVATDPGGCATPTPGQPWTWQVTGIAQAWAGGQANNGIVLRGVDESATAPLYDRGWRASEAGGQIPVLTVTYVQAPAAVAKAGVDSTTMVEPPNRHFYQHATFTECDASANRDSVWRPGGWVKNSFSWCKKVKHVLSKWQFYWILGTWEARKLGEATYVYTSLIKTFVGRSVPRTFNGPADPLVRTVFAKSRISNVRKFNNPAWDDRYTLRPAWTVTGCAEAGVNTVTRTIGHWADLSESVVEFEYRSDEADADNADRAAGCSFRPYIEVGGGLALPSSRIRGVEAGQHPVVRCDTSPFVRLYYGGCVLVRSLPRMVVSIAPSVRQRLGGRIARNVTQEFAQHIYDVFTVPDATQPPKPGGGKRFPGNGAPNEFSAPLTRATDPLVAATNRAVMAPACVACWPPEDRQGRDCDEYPFAATHEGAASPDWDFSVRPISPSSNRSGGAVQRILWARYRVLEGDPFKVWVSTSNIVPDRWISGDGSALTGLRRP